MNILMNLDKEVKNMENTEELEQSIKDLEPIYRPAHYCGDNEVEAFDVMQGFVGDLKGMQAFYWCNVIKYLLRFQGKNGFEDLRKAQNYLEMLINDIDKERQ